MPVSLVVLRWVCVEEASGPEAVCGVFRAVCVGCSALKAKVTAQSFCFCTETQWLTARKVEEKQVPINPTVV